MRAQISRLPIRLRLVIGFAIVMAFVLATTGAFVYERTRSDLDGQIDRELSARLAGVIAIIRDDGDDLGDPIQDPLDRVDPEGSVQVLVDGRVVDATSEALRSEPLLDGPTTEGLIDAGAASAETEGPEGPLRIVAGHATDDGVRYVTLVGAALDERERTLSDLARLLLIGGPAALLLASLAAFGVASAALRPVESIRRRAAEIGERHSSARLPVPPADDEIALLAATLNEMLGRLERGMQRERRFVADASHELRTPLTILKVEIELALAAGRSPAELRAALTSSGEEVERLNRLADDLLVLARADDGRLPLQAEDVAVADLVRAAADRFSARLEGRELSVEVPEQLHISVDPLRIEQALTNLIDNALRHGDGPITISARSVDGAIEIHVRDEGAGIPEEIREHVLQRFARGGGERSTGGAGLGLAIVEAIASAHGGRVEVGRPAGAGADLALVLPVPRTAPSPDAKGLTGL